MIELSVLKGLMQQRMHGHGEDFDLIFYLSVNDVIRDLITTTILDVDVIETDGTDVEIDLDDKYFPVFRDGVEYFMQQNATWARQSDQLSDAKYRRSLGLAQSMAFEDEPSDMRLDYDDD